MRLSLSEVHRPNHVWVESNERHEVFVNIRWIPLLSISKNSSHTLSFCLFVWWVFLGIMWGYIGVKVIYNYILGVVICINSKIGYLQQLSSLRREWAVLAQCVSQFRNMWLVHVIWLPLNARNLKCHVYPNKISLSRQLSCQALLCFILGIFKKIQTHVVSCVLSILKKHLCQIITSHIPQST